MTPEEYKEQKPVHDAAVHSALEHLADKEAAFTTARYGNYHSPHEGLAIIEEEAFEAEMAREGVGTAVNTLQAGTYAKWNSWAYRAECASSVRDEALKLAQEAIHVATTAQRFLQAMEAGSGEFANLKQAANLATNLQPTCNRGF